MRLRHALPAALAAGLLLSLPAAAGNGKSPGHQQHQIDKWDAKLDHKQTQLGRLEQQLHDQWQSPKVHQHTHDKENHKSRVERAIEHLLDKIGAALGLCGSCSSTNVP